MVVTTSDGFQLTHVSHDGGMTRTITEISEQLMEACPGPL